MKVNKPALFVSFFFIFLTILTGVSLFSLPKNKTIERDSADTKFISRLLRKQKCLSYLNIDINSFTKINDFEVNSKNQE